MMNYLKNKKLWVRDCNVCAKEDYRLNIRVVNENPCCNLFAYNMFLRPEKHEISNLNIHWYLIQLPRFFADPSFILPHQKNILSMHCSVNVGKKGDSALFFGLSGTGKTTLNRD